MKNALMPGVMSEPLPEIGAAPMRAAPMAKPVKKRNPLVNALSAVFEYGAPEAFEAGRQKRMTRDAGNALASGNYEQAANTYLQGGDIEQGLKLRSEGEAQATAKRQQEAQSVLSLFSQMPALQINEMAMSDPANFERMTGMTSEEYLQAAQRSGDPEKFRQFVITKAQAELGQMPAGPAEGKVVNNRLVDPITGEVRGDYSDPTKPIEVNGVLVDPVTYQPVADFRTPAQTGGMTEYQRAQLEADAAAAAIPKATAPRPMREDSNGVLRYLDGAQEPVFANVAPAPAAAKPLIGSEAMARVTAGLPNAKQAVEDLDRLVFRSKATPLSAEGYDPASDWGAATIEAIPDFGLLKGVARTVGGEDYQLFKDSYGSFEAAMLPIISGAAITESEGLRQMRALEIKPGDSEQTKTRKIAGMRAMVQGVEMAARGDTAGFISMLDQAGSISGAGPVKRSGAAAPVTGLEDASDDDLFMIMRGN